MEEKWFLSKGGAWRGPLIEGVCCWGSCHIKGHCLDVCLFDCRFGVRVKIIYYLTRLAVVGIGAGGCRAEVD